MIKPNVNEKLQDVMLDEAVENALADGEDIENCRFYGDAFPETSGRLIEFHGCVFEKCTIGENEIERMVFTDCVFVRCDMSRCNLKKSTLQRVEFRECRLIGASFENAVLMSVSFGKCQMDFCNFSNAKAQHLLMQECSMKENAFISYKWKEWTMRLCDLTGCEFGDTSLKGLDVTDCLIGNWHTDLYALRGLKVTKEQAVTFAGLLGLNIMDL